MNKAEDHSYYLQIAELQFRLASAVRLATSSKKQPLVLPMDWTHGEHRVKYHEIALRQDQADFAAWNLHQSATFLMAVAIKDAIKSVVEDPKTSKVENIRSAYEISRLIRNAFAHAPFHPTWSIDPDCRDKIFTIKDIITLDTTELQDKTFNWRHYGGPLALFRLCQYVRYEILRDTKKPRVVIPFQKEYLLQQGNLIIERVKEIPKGAKKITSEEFEKRTGVKIVTL